MTRIVAIIPARGGSRGIPRKNLSIFRGETLVDHAIKFAKTLSVDKVILSSDSDVILEVGNSNTITAIKRSDVASDDMASDLDVVKELYRDAHITEQDILVWLRPTAPIRSRSDTMLALDLIIGDLAVNALRSVAEVPAEFHPSWQCVIDGGEIKPHNGNLHGFNNITRRQELVPSYYFTCQFELIRMRQLLLQNVFYPGPIRAWCVEDPGVDINTPRDLKVLQSLYP